MHGQRVVVNEAAVRIPQRLQQQAPRHNAAPLHQREQNAVFCQRQQYRFAIPAHLHARLIHLNAAAGKHRGLLAAAGAQQRPDAAEQLHHAEGLGHIIVAPGIQRAHHVQLLVPGGEEQDGRRHARAAPLAAQGHAVPVGEADVQHNHVHLAGQPFPGFQSAGGGNNAVPLPGKQLGQPAPQDGVVFNKQDGGHGRSS